MSDTGAKGRKIGRHSRSGAMAAYKNSRRDLTNKERKIAKHAKDSTPRAGTTPRGTARAMRRHGLGNKK